MPLGKPEFWGITKAALIVFLLWSIGLPATILTASQTRDNVAGNLGTILLRVGLADIGRRYAANPVLCASFRHGGRDHQRTTQETSIFELINALEFTSYLFLLPKRQTTDLTSVENRSII
jgi:hypothetical protein